MSSSVNPADYDPQDQPIPVYDVVSILTKNGLVPRLDLWEQAIRTVNPDEIYVFPLTVIPDTLMESPFFREVAQKLISPAQYVETDTEPKMAEYLLQLEKFKLKGNLTLFDYNCEVVLTIERDVPNGNNNDEDVPQESLLVARISLGLDDPMYQGLFQWTNEHGREDLMPF